MELSDIDASRIYFNWMIRGAFCLRITTHPGAPHKMVNSETTLSFLIEAAFLISPGSDRSKFFCDIFIFWRPRKVKETPKIYAMQSWKLCKASQEGNEKSKILRKIFNVVDVTFCF